MIEPPAKERAEMSRTNHDTRSTITRRSQACNIIQCLSCFPAPLALHVVRTGVGRNAYVYVFCYTVLKLTYLHYTIDKRMYRSILIQDYDRCHIKGCQPPGRLSKKS